MNYELIKKIKGAYLLSEKKTFREVLDFIRANGGASDVTTIQKALELEQATLSGLLAAGRKYKFVKVEKLGKYRLYSICRMNEFELLKFSIPREEVIELSKPTSFKLIEKLKAGPKNVTELSGAVKKPQTTVSLTLARLKALGFVGCTKNGKERVYFVYMVKHNGFNKALGRFEGILSRD